MAEHGSDISDADWKELRDDMARCVAAANDDRIPEQNGYPHCLVSTVVSHER